MEEKQERETGHDSDNKRYKYKKKKIRKTLFPFIPKQTEINDAIRVRKYRNRKKKRKKKSE